MPVEFNVTADLRQAEKLFGKQGQNRVRRAASRALNKTARDVRTTSSKEIRGDLPIAASTVRKAFIVNRAGPSNLIAIVSVRGKARIGLIELRPKPRQIKKGVRYKLDGKKRLVKSAFRAALGSKQKVFKRRSNWKHERVGDEYHGLPIAEITVPGIPLKFKQKDTENLMLKVAADKWPRNFDGLIKLELAKLK